MRIGPTIITKIIEEVTCKGCKFLSTDAKPQWQLIENTCRHPVILKGNRLGLTIGYDSKTQTPDWCPERKKGRP